MTEYEVRFLNKQGLDGGITVRATDVHDAMKMATEMQSDRIAKITAVLPWDLINELTKK